MKNLFVTLSLFFSFAAISGFAQTANEDKVPIKVSRVIVAIEEGTIIGERYAVEKLPRPSVNKDTKANDLIKFNRSFRISSSFYEENLQTTIESHLIKNGFQVSGWSDLFPEIQKESKPLLSIGFIVQSLTFNFDKKTAVMAYIHDSFLSNLKITTKVLNNSSQTVVINKDFSSAFFTEIGGNYYSISNEAAQNSDFKLYIDKALAKFVAELVADADFKKAVEDAKTKSAYPTAYDKITITKTAPKADRPAALKTALDGSVTVVTGGKYGSGVIISKDGLVLTCSHVVGGNDVTEVILSNQVRLKAKVLRNLPEYDAALLQLEGASANPLPIGNSTKAEIGEELWVIGTPSATELGQSVSKGILSGKRVMEEKSYLQTDASVSPGNSGGPLINQKGEIVGLVNAKVISRGTEGVGFAIPIDVVLEKLSLVIVE